jgi:hypothetical protein
VPQSEFCRHATQVLVDVWQSGVEAGQSPFAAHCTHCFVVASQTLALAGQSAAVMHPTQAPVVVSHSVPPRQDAEPSAAVHAAWQVWVPG